MSAQRCSYAVNEVFEICSASAESLQFLRVLKNDRVVGEVVFFDLSAYDAALVRSRDQHRQSAARRAQKRRTAEADDVDTGDGSMENDASDSPSNAEKGRSRGTFLVRMTYEELEELEAEKRIFDSTFRTQFSPPKDHEVLDDPSLSNKERERRSRARATRDAAWNAIESLVKGEALSHLLVRGVTGSLIVTRAAELQGLGLRCSPNKIYTYLYRYFAFGMTPNALLPGDHRKGHPIEPRVYPEGTRAGRKSKRNPHLPPDVPQPQRRATSELDKRRFRESFRTIKRNGDTPRMAYNKMLVEKYKVGTFVTTERGEARVKLNPGVSEFDFPSLETYLYYYDKEVESVTRAQRASSRGDFARNKERLGGDSKRRIFGLGDEFQIDSTPSLCALRSDLDPKRILGPATCYNIVEVRTTLIVGQYFTWLAPSWETFRQALFVAFTGAAKYYRRFEVEVDPDAFPASPIICQCVRADRQESVAMLSSETLVKGLQIDIGNPPPARPNLNCFTERYHQLLNDLAGIAGVPGSPPAGGVDKGEQSPVFKAILTRAEFARLCILAAEHHNKFAVLTKGVPARAVGEGIRPHPINLYNWLLHNSASTPRTRPEAEIRLKLLPQSFGRVTDHGIEFAPDSKGEKRRYTCETAIKEDWFTRARVRKSWKVRVWFHWDYSKHIWIERNDGTLEECNLIADHDYGAYGFDELGPALELTYTAMPSERHAELESTLNIAATNAKLQRDGKERAKVLNSTAAPLSKAEQNLVRTSDLAQEQAIERQSLVDDFAAALVPQTPPTNPELTTPVESTRQTRLTAMIRSRLKKAIQEK